MMLGSSSVVGIAHPLPRITIILTVSPIRCIAAAHKQPIKFDNYSATLGSKLPFSALTCGGKYGAKLLVLARTLYTQTNYVALPIGHI